MLVCTVFVVYIESKYAIFGDPNYYSKHYEF